MSERTGVIKYLFHEKYSSNVKLMSELTGYSERQIIDWVEGVTVPQKATIEYISMCTYAPEFKVVSEFYEVDGTQSIKPQLNVMFKGHEEKSGVYAFYDAMANLLYVGKAKNLLQETYSAIRRNDEIKFPSGIKDGVVYRYELVKYISAYEVGTFDYWDYPKHVESLILRISKPRLNKQIGILEKAYPELG